MNFRKPLHLNCRGLEVPVMSRLDYQFDGRAASRLNEILGDLSFGNCGGPDNCVYNLLATATHLKSKKLPFPILNSPSLEMACSHSGIATSNFERLANQRARDVASKMSFHVHWSFWLASICVPSFLIFYTFRRYNGKKKLRRRKRL